MPPQRRSSAKLLLKMLQPDEGIVALGKILWGPAKTSGVNRLVLICVVLDGRYIAQRWRFISIAMTKKSSRIQSEVFLCGNFTWSCYTVYMVTQRCVSSRGCVDEENKISLSVPTLCRYMLKCIIMLIFMFGDTSRKEKQWITVLPLLSFRSVGPPQRDKY